MTMDDVFQMFREDLTRVDQWMGEALRSEVALIPEIGGHLIGSGGKRFRPLLLLASSALCGYEGDRRYPLAAVIEFIHTATLLHDDVIDQAHTRRGKVSANNIWGNAASVLVGDYLYSKAFKLMAEYGDLPVIDALSATTNLMSEGEVLQLVKCGAPSLSEGDYLRIIERKTAVLIAAACTMGAMLSGTPPERVEALRGFGLQVGTAFQMTDDALDYTALADAFGKAIGKDLDEGKLTLPLIRTLALCSPGERGEAVAAIRKEDRSEEDIAYLLALIERYDGISYALAQAARAVAVGKAALAVFPDTPPRQALMTIADYVIDRKR